MEILKNTVKVKIGILKETKTPPDMRVPLSPTQCAEINKNPEIELVVQSSDIRTFSDQEYKDAGVTVVDSVEDCDILMGVKEVKKDYLIPNKTYFYFSHTIKEQPYNRDLLLTMMDKNIQMIDYETLTSPKGPRLIGFGRYAGIVGCYNTFLAYGKKFGKYELKPASQCEDHKELNQELKKVVLPNDYKIVVTGFGRVGRGAAEILTELGIKQVSAQDFISKTFNQPVYTQLEVEDYNERLDGKPFVKEEFYKSAKGYQSTFMQYAKVANMYVACHYWDAEAPFIFTREDAKSPDFNIDVVGDVSCDIDGPVASTLRPSTIANPLYGYNPKTENEAEFNDNETIGVMAVDNLPCELPKDASKDFGNEFIKNILPSLLNGDKDKIIEKATICKNGKLTEYYSYLQNYVDGK